MLLEENKSLQKIHTFGIAVKARYYSLIHNRQELEALLAMPLVKSLPKLILGQGSNILFIEDFDGLVLQINIQGIKKIQENKAHVWLRVGAGLWLHDVVLTCVAKNYSGIENLSLIPGTVGAGPIQNVGAYGVVFSDVFESLEALELATGKIRTFTAEDCDFGYRTSIFKEALQGQYVILHVVIRLDKKPTFRTSYGTLQAALEEKGITQLSIKAISDTIVDIRQQRLPDSTVVGNAGSFFENPIIDLAQLTLLQQQYPALPMHALPENRFTIPAAWLIEECGWKGYRQGDIGVFSKHALILVNYGNGTGQAVYQLASMIQESVWQRFNIRLVAEVNIIGRTGRHRLGDLVTPNQA